MNSYSYACIRIKHKNIKIRIEIVLIFKQSAGISWSDESLNVS